MGRGGCEHRALGGRVTRGRVKLWAVGIASAATGALLAVTALPLAGEQAPRQAAAASRLRTA